MNNINIDVNINDISVINKYEINRGEYKVNLLTFNFSKDYDGLVKKALFKNENEGQYYEMAILDNKCDIPNEVLHSNKFLLGVYAYEIVDEELQIRFSPKPIYMHLDLGSYQNETITTEEITPTQFEQYCAKLEEGLKEVADIVAYAQEQGDYAKENGEYAQIQGDYASITANEINKKLINGELNGATFIPNINEEGILSWTNNKNLDNPPEQNIKGPQGPMGPQGEAFTIKKTYSSIAEMQSDFDNMNVGDYVMIANSVETEDNAKLYTKTIDAWVFITDFSGATGIQGEQGPQGIQGIQGPIGPQGEKPIAGIDYFTEEDKNEMIEEISRDANSKFNQNVAEKISEYNANASDVLNSVDIICPKDKRNGENIFIEDAINYNLFDFKIFGNSYQKTTRGANLFNINEMRGATSNGITSVIENGTITLNGTMTALWANVGTSLNQELKAGTYTLSRKEATGNAIAINLVINSKNTGERLGDFVLSSTSRYVTKTYEEDIIIKQIFITTTEQNKVITDFKISDIQIETGNVVTEYEEYTYGASPNVNYPQNVQNIEGDLDISILGENLYNYKDTKTVSNGITVDDDGWITATCDNTYGTDVVYLNYWTNNLRLKPSTKYLIVAEIKNVSGTGVFAPVTKILNNSQIQVQGQFTDDARYNFTDLTSDSIKTFTRTSISSDLVTEFALRSYIAFTSGQNGSITFRLSVLEDTSITSDTFKYKPYQGELTNIDLKGNFIGKLDNEVMNILKIDKIGNISLIKNVGYTVLDGTENITRIDTKTPDEYRFKISKGISNIVTTENNYIVIPILSDKFKAIDRNGSYAKTEGICYGNKDGYYGNFVIYSDKTKNMTVDEFKTFLTENNVKVYYRLAETEIVELGNLTTLLKTFKGSNSIKVIANLPSNLEIEYALDIKKYVDNLFGGTNEI